MKKKKVMKLAYLLMGVALLLSSCSEDIFPGGSESNEDVTISLAYSDVSPRDIVVNSRATPEEERHLDNLYIYIFDGNGNLKGYKGFTSGLDQKNNNDTKATVSGIKTRSGESYIYAVANYNTGRYPLTVSERNVEKGKLPINLDEEKARAGEYTFTLNDLKALNFQRNVDDQISITDAFLMSGAVNNGKIVNINTAGNVTSDDTNGNAIRLSRIVSKVKFTIKEYTGDGVQRSFKLANYDIMNIAKNGTLIGSIDSNAKKQIRNATDVSSIKGLTLGVNDVDKTTGAEYFEVYLPENLQDAKLSVTDRAKREDDNMWNPKEFTNAPKYGTYVVLKGKYEETKDGSTKTAETTYYVHLGDCSANYNDYNVERNCKYTFNITVAGVNKIIVEAKKEGNEQPGAEGVVMEYGNMGKNLTLDSHYEYMVMRFEREHIQNLKKYNLGYFYQVYALGKKTDPINVKDEANTQEHQQQRNGVNISWIEFAITGRNGSKSIYGDANNGRGIPCDYPGKGKTMDIETFLKMLYDNAGNDSFWTNGEYIDATCFVSENYYSNLSWDQYVNDVDKRAFYVASYVWVSKDTRSVYAKAQYGLTQHNIQTFYDRNKAGSVTAYGCETINDEEKPGGGDTGFDINDQIEGSNGNDYWNGRANMKLDIFNNGKPVITWDGLKHNISLRIACMSRNRDLNGDGIIQEDEMRWYAPATHQYAGLWIGEEIMSTESKLFNKSTKILKRGSKGDVGRMVYYSSTRDLESFLSEEGMTTGNYDSRNSPYRPKYVRCVRNLKSGEIGYGETPDPYYSYNSGTKTVTLDKVDEDALNITGEQGELFDHTERDEGNKPAKKFTIAASLWNGEYYYKGEKMTPTPENVYNGKYWCYGRYIENNEKNWRVPNQRELCIMSIVASDDALDSACRTHFSNMNFRQSWTYRGYRNSRMLTMSLTSVKGVRCIKVLK